MKDFLKVFGLCLLMFVGYLVVAQLQSKPKQAHPAPVIQEEKVNTFCRLVDEYNQVVQVELTSVGEKALEKAHMAHYYTFIYLADYYWNVLDSAERAAVFSKDFPHENFPSGIVMDVGGPLDSLFGIPLGTDNPKNDFETFIQESFRDIDYQSMFQIAQDGSYLKLKEQTMQDLAKRFP